MNGGSNIRLFLGTTLKLDFKSSTIRFDVIEISVISYIFFCILFLIGLSDFIFSLKVLSHLLSLEDKTIMSVLLSRFLLQIHTLAEMKHEKYKLN